VLSLYDWQTVDEFQAFAMQWRNKYNQYRLNMTLDSNTPKQQLAMVVK
jgi:hypothetical protein